ncbi:MAG: hypothetical protein LBR06_10825 [Bacteroidales bacterium]|jgi:hypothetical protein|nr:hypothetical protein [Bacteroidales bacterium]
MNKAGFLCAGLFLPFLLCVAVSCTSEEEKRIATVYEGWYNMYITGTKGHSVELVYPARKKAVSGSGRTVTAPFSSTAEHYIDENGIVTERVTLPYSCQVHILHGDLANSEAYLEIHTANDSTTHAILFSHNVIVSNGSDCWNTVENLFHGATENCLGCRPCKGFTMDSVVHYLGKVGYPCYMKFRKHETVKRVELADAVDWDYY